MSKNSEWRGSCNLCGAGIYGPRGICEDCRHQLAHRRATHNPFVAYARRHFGDAGTSVILGLALEDAAAEGRLSPEIAAKLNIETGQYTCRICGMRQWTIQDTTECCAGMIAISAKQRELSQIRERAWAKRRAKSKNNT